MKLAIFLLAALLGSSAFARLGETPDECVKRYGAELTPNPKDPEGHIHEAGGFRVYVKYTNGLASFLTISKLSKLNREPLTEHEIRTLLAANAGKAKWTEGEKNRLEIRRWIRDDGAAKALADEHEITFQILEKRGPHLSGF